MRLAFLTKDFWELRSAELAHQQNPNTFWIPPLSARQSLIRGQAARLIFDIEGEDENGNVFIQGERMNVIVAERYENIYIGLLDDQPASLEPSEDVCLPMFWSRDTILARACDRHIGTSGRVRRTSARARA